VTEVELALGHAHEHLDGAGRLADPTQEEALRDSVRVLLGELENAEVAASRTSVDSPRLAISSYGLTGADPPERSRAWRNGHPASPYIPRVGG
jgi:hypothetical protein